MEANTPTSSKCSTEVSLDIGTKEKVSGKQAPKNTYIRFILLSLISTVSLGWYAPFHYFKTSFYCFDNPTPLSVQIQRVFFSSLSRKLNLYRNWK